MFSLHHDGLVLAALGLAFLLALALACGEEGRGAPVVPICDPACDTPLEVCLEGACLLACSPFLSEPEPDLGPDPDSCPHGTACEGGACVSLLRCAGDEDCAEGRRCLIFGGSGESCCVLECRGDEDCAGGDRCGGGACLSLDVDAPDCPR